MTPLILIVATIGICIYIWIGIQVYLEFAHPTPKSWDDINLFGLLLAIIIGGLLLFVVLLARAFGKSLKWVKDTLVVQNLIFGFKQLGYKFFQIINKKPAFFSKFIDWLS